MSRRLELVLTPMAPGELWAYTLARVEWRADEETGVEQAPGDFRRTNALMNDLRRTSVPAQLMYSGVSLWQFLPAHIWPDVHRAAELIDVLLPLVDRVRPEVILAAPAAGDDAAVWPLVVEAVAAARGIRSETSHPADTAVTLSGEAGGARAVAGRVRRRLASSRFARQRGARRALLVTLGHRHWMPRPGTDEHWDEQISPLLEPLREVGFDDFLVVDAESLPRALLRERDTSGVRWRAFREFERRASTPIPAFNTDSSLGYRGVTLSAVVARRVQPLLAQAASDLATAAASLDRYRPDVVIVTYETGPRGRAFVIESVRRGIPSVGLMHGMIFDNHYDYMHDSVTVHPFEDPLMFAIPTRTCLWGPYWRDVLVERGSYPASSVRVTGNWRYDGVVHGTPDRRSARARLGVEDGERIVAVLSGARRTDMFLAQALHAIRSLEGVAPLVKLHSIDDPELGRRSLAEAGFPADHLVEGRFAETLVAADAVVSQVSTAVGEAAYLDRAVVVADFDDVGGWLADIRALEAFILVEDPLELPSAIREALMGDARHAAGRQALAETWFAGRSGDAARRVAAAVADTCKRDS